MAISSLPIVSMAVGPFAAETSAAKQERPLVRLVTTPLAAGQQANLIVERAGTTGCSLRLDGPGPKTAGPFGLRTQRQLVSWVWRVPRAVDGGLWLAKVSCGAGKQRVQLRQPLRIHSNRRNGRASAVAPGSMRVVGLRSMPRGRPGGKGAGVDCSPGVLNPASGYCTGYCTEYAWTQRRDLHHLGNAADWWGRTRAPKGRVPVAGSIAWWGGNGRNPFGHVAYVADVQPGRIVVREANYLGWNRVSSRTIYLGNQNAPNGYIYGGPAGNGPGGGAPQPERVPSDLWFVKTKGPGSGRVEVHSATVGSNFQDGRHGITWFSPGDADNGWFQMVGPDLFFAKTKNTGSGRVEVHSATAASGYQSGQHNVTWFSPGDADNGWFQMVGGDLFFVKTRNTGSGRVEVHSATASSGYQSGQHSVTWFSPADASNGWFQMVGPDLFFVKTRNTGSGRVEVHSATAASGYQSGQHSITWFSPADANNGWFQMVGADLYFVKTKGPGSGRVEVHSATAGSGYQSGQHSITWFSPADADNGWFQVAGGKG